MVNNYNRTNEVGYAEFNMGVASMQRIDAIIKKITEYKSILYLNGMPLYSLTLNLLKRLYMEVYPYLEQKERDYATTTFIEPFKLNPIVNSGNGLMFPQLTEDLMETFELWMMATMMDKGILTKIGDSPYDIEM